MSVLSASMTRAHLSPVRTWPLDSNIQHRRGNSIELMRPAESPLSVGAESIDTHSLTARFVMSFSGGGGGGGYYHSTTM